MAIFLFADIIQNQQVLQQSMVQVMTDLNKIKGALLKSNMQETDEMFEPTRHSTPEGLFAFCDSLAADPSKRDLFVSVIFLMYVIRVFISRCL